VMRGENKTAFEAFTVRPVRWGSGSLPVAIVGLLSQAYAKQVAQWNPDLTVADPAAVLDKLQPELEAKAKFVLLLFHGELEDARALVRSRPWVNVAVTAHEAEEYRAQAVTEGGTMLVNAGQKGKHVGQVEIKSTADGEPVPELLAPVAMEETIGDDPATRDILRQYLSHVASENLLAAVPKQKSPNGQAFAGTANCLKCHAKAHQVWTKSAHAHAFRTLANVGHQADPDCVGCHVVGLEFQGGFRTIAQTPQFKDVGCEACHKPQATHARKPAAFKPKKVGATACANCHVPDHSPGFEFARYWAKIKH
jgi:Cytochrome c554 and c-prime